MKVYVITINSRECFIEDDWVEMIYGIFDDKKKAEDAVLEAPTKEDIKEGGAIYHMENYYKIEEVELNTIIYSTKEA